MRQTVNSSQGRIHGINTFAETFQSEQQTTAIDAQEVSPIEKLKTEHAVLQQKYDKLSFRYKQCVLRIEHVLAKDTTFKFYTGLQNYATFKVAPYSCRTNLYRSVWSFVDRQMF